MKGKLTQKLEKVVFKKCPPLLWGVIHTYANCEKVVQGILKEHGIESYLPMITLYENGLKTGIAIQTPGYIYACWDCHNHPGLCTNRNKMYRDTIHHCETEDGLLQTMVVCRKLELISNTYPVSVCDTPAKGDIITLPDSDLAGSIGILSKENDHTVFFLQLDSSSYAKIQLG